MSEIHPAAPSARRSRRRHEPAFREEVVKAASQAGVSFSSVARLFGLNTSVVRRWVKLTEVREQRETHAQAARLTALRARQASASESFGKGAIGAAAFVPIALSAASTIGAGVSSDIRVEFNRGSTTVSVVWPVSAAEHCGAWLSELLR